jgi:hypothetical protein
MQTNDKQLPNKYIFHILFLAVLFTATTFSGSSAALDPGEVASTSALPAFPGAQGGGALARGGRGGAVYAVTNLMDNGPGSLRYGLEDLTGPRTIIFRVAGYIHLQDDIFVGNDAYITIAGQTAPGDGITLVLPSDPDQSIIGFHNTHDVIIRYLRFRRGGHANDQRGSAFSISGNSHDIIVDHCSIGWGGDENISLWSQNVDPGLKNITVQWSIASEGLWNDHHSTGLISGTNTNPNSMTDISLHHNLFARNNNRNPLQKVMSGDITNNIIYNWRWWATGVSGGMTVDIIGNHYKYGPAHTSGRPEISIHPYWADASSPPMTGVDGNPSIYLAGNTGPHNSDPEADAWDSMMTLTAEDSWGYPDGVRTNVPREYERFSPRTTPAPIDITPVTELEALLLADGGVGASRRLDENGVWVFQRDQVDARVLQDYVNGTGDTLLENVDDVSPDGGWPYWTGAAYAYVLESEFIAHPDDYPLQTGTPYPDADADGMSDVWEQHHGLNPNDAADRLEDGDHDGYENLEEFLNGTDPNVGASLDCWAAPGPGKLHLAWQVTGTIDPDAAWRISYTGPAGDPPSPIANIPLNYRGYELSGLSNGVSYAITLEAVLDGQTIFSATTNATPAANATYLPVLSLSMQEKRVLRLQWDEDADYRQYQVWRSNTPYFTLAGADAGWVTASPWQFDDPGALGNPAANHYYRVMGIKADGSSTLSGRMGEFDFEIK